MNEAHMQMAINIAQEGLKSPGNGPFGAVITRDDKIIAIGINKVAELNDPTAHAEIVAIRRACQKIGAFSLVGCEIYTTCEPCPMCLAAIYWSNLDEIIYGASRKDAKNAQFDDDYFYEELNKTSESRAIKSFQIKRLEAIKLFEIWKKSPFKISYNPGFGANDKNF